MAVTTESYAGKIQRKLLKKQKVIEAASGRKKADLVLKNATFVNVFSNELTTCDIACANGLIVGLGEYDGEVEYDMTGKIVCPGFIDAHIHLESSLVSPKEFVRATLPHGTTTVITDPHEITNVMGTGLDNGHIRMLLSGSSRCRGAIGIDRLRFRGTGGNPRTLQACRAGKL
mgnify:CR=1 FL=1